MINVVNLIKLGRETDFEKEYIYDYLLSNILKDKELNLRLIVYSSNTQNKKPDIETYGGDVLLHLSNENLNYDYSFLNTSNTVLRSYYNPLIKHKKVYHVPLGYQTGFSNSNNIKGENNKYMWSFIGQMKTFRKPMYEAFKKHEPHYSSLSEKWNSQLLTFDEVKQIYLNTAFAPCPFGSVHADTIRVMEVLEWGCIPVVTHFLGNDYFKYIYGDHPFIVGRNWADVAKHTYIIYNYKELLKKKQMEIKAWYEKFKSDLTEDISSIIAGRLENLKSSQFQYQKNGRNHLFMKLRYYYHFHIKTKTIY